MNEAKRDYLRTMILMPFRRAELADALTSAYDPAADRIVLEGRVTKNGDDFAIPCPPAASAIIKARLKAANGVPSTRLFPMSTKPGAKMETYSDLVADWRKASGVSTIQFSRSAPPIRDRTG